MPSGSLIIGSPEIFSSQLACRSAFAGVAEVTGVVGVSGTSLSELVAILLSAAANSDLKDGEGWTECRRIGIWPGKVGELVDFGEMIEGSMGGGEMVWEVNVSV